VNTLPTSSPSPTAAPAVTVTGLPDGVQVEISDGEPGTSPGDGLDFASPVYSLGPTGPLGAKATVTIQLDHAVPRGTTVVVATRESSSDSWAWLPATLTPDLMHARFTTTHFSQFGVLTLDVASALSTYKQAVHTALTSTVVHSVKKPLCEDPKEARQGGYRVASWPRKTLAWCFGMVKGKRVLTVVNRRPFPVQVSHGDAAATATTSKVHGVWTTWLGILAPGSKDTFLAPGGAVTYDAELEPGDNLVVGAESDVVAQSTRALYAAVQALVTQLDQYGVTTPTAVEGFQVLVARPQCADALGQSSEVLRAGCLSPLRLTKALGANARLLTPMLHAPSMKRFWARQLAFLAKQDQTTDSQHIGVSLKDSDFGDLVGTFTGHTRVLTVSKTGLAVEKVDDGTDRVIQLTYQLSDPTVTGRKTGQKTGGTTTAKAVLTKVKVYDRKAIGGQPPKVGDTGTITFRNGIVTPPYLQTTYCDKATASTGQCGA
jgi:hypothetical protein